MISTEEVAGLSSLILYYVVQKATSQMSEPAFGPMIGPRHSVGVRGRLIGSSTAEGAAGFSAKTPWGQVWTVEHPQEKTTARCLPSPNTICRVFKSIDHWYIYKMKRQK